MVSPWIFPSPFGFVRLFLSFFTLARDPTSPFRSCTAEVVCGGGGDGNFLKKVLLVWVFVGVCWLLLSLILEVVESKMGSILVGVEVGGRP